MDILANPIVSQIISICVAALCGWLGATAAGIKKRDEALYAGMRVLLRAQLFDSYDTYAVHGEKISFERKEEVEQAYRAYSSLGGNGVVTKMWETIMALPVETIH